MLTKDAEHKGLHPATPRTLLRWGKMGLDAKGYGRLLQSIPASGTDDLIIAGE